MLCPQGVDARGTFLCICDTAHHRVRIVDISVDPPGVVATLGALGTNPNVEGFLFPRVARFVTASLIVVADTQNAHLDIYELMNGAWAYSSTIGAFGAAVGGVGHIPDLLRVSDTHVLVLDAPGKRLVTVPVGGGDAVVALSQPHWAMPSAIATGGGYTWVADAGTHKVYRYDAEGNEEELGGFGVRDGCLSRPLGVVFDQSSNSILVAEGDTSRISRFDTSGAFVEGVRLPAGTAHEAHTLCLDDDGDLWVADAGSGSIYRVEIGAPAALLVAHPGVMDIGRVWTGYRSTRTVRVRNEGTAPATITGLSPLNPPFSVAPAAGFPLVVPDGSEIDVHLTLAPTAVGTFEQRLEVMTSSAEQPVVPLHVTGVGAESAPLCLALVVDRSGSMVESSGSMTKIERLRSVVALMTAVVGDRVGDSLGLVSFSASSVVEADLTANSEEINERAGAMIPAGGTSIGAGLIAAADLLRGSEIQKRVAVIITDGVETALPSATSPVVTQAVLDANVRVFTVGLGLPENIDVGLLSTLAVNNGGYFQVTDERAYQLPKFLMQCFADSVGVETALDPVFAIRPGQPQLAPFQVSPDDAWALIVLTWEQPKWMPEVAVLTPLGVVVPVGAETFKSSRPRHLVLRVPVPTPGEWSVRISANVAADDVVLTVMLASPYQTDWSVTPVRSVDDRRRLPKVRASGVRAFVPSRDQNRVAVPGVVGRGTILELLVRPATGTPAFVLIDGSVVVRRVGPAPSPERLGDRTEDRAREPPARGRTRCISARTLGALLFAALAIAVGAALWLHPWGWLAVLVLIIVALSSGYVVWSGRPRRYAFKPAGRSARARVELAGLSGTLEVHCRVTGRTESLGPVQRERTFNIVVR